MERKVDELTEENGVLSSQVMIKVIFVVVVVVKKESLTYININKLEAVM